MSNPLVECVPNFSEGRRKDVIDAIVNAITSAAPIRLLDRSSDADHNRTVVTFVGAPDDVVLAAFAGIKMAAQLIDLDNHKGQHPRLGATDVVPFIPIRDVTMDECIGLATRLGQWVGDELKIPVYLYESAATRPERENLEVVRRGEYEALKTAIGTDPDRAPDFGPSKLPKAGATIIGARPPLIAYNVYLTTADVEIAKKIAKAIRNSSGGLRFVKALGLLVEGRAQVSMNLTNYEKTPVYRVQEMIRREAERYGVGIAFSELVGLIPENALIDAAQWYLQLDMFEPAQILERKVMQAEMAALNEAMAAVQAVRDLNTAIIPEPPMPEGATLVSPATKATIPSRSAVNVPSAPYSQHRPPTDSFVEQVAAGTAAPGGGAVAAMVGTLAAALAEMVARLTIGKKKYADVDAQMQKYAIAAELLRGKLLEAVELDSEAYQAVMRASKLDKSNPAREGEIQVAMYGAANMPLEVMRLSTDAMKLAGHVIEKGNVNAVTDGAVAVHMAMAAIESAALNVRVNARSITDRDAAAHFQSVAGSLVDNARTLSAELLRKAEARAGLV